MWKERYCYKYIFFLDEFVNNMVFKFLLRDVPICGGLVNMALLAPSERSGSSALHCSGGCEVNV